MPRQGDGRHGHHRSRHSPHRGHPHRSMAESTSTTARSTTATSSGTGSTAPSTGPTASMTALTTGEMPTRALSVAASEHQPIDKEVEPHAPVPPTLYVQQPADFASWQVKGVLCLLFGFLVALLAALCYALFNFLLAAPDPTRAVTTPITVSISIAGPPSSTSRNRSRRTRRPVPTVMPPSTMTSTSTPLIPIALTTPTQTRVTVATAATTTAQAISTAITGTGAAIGTTSSAATSAATSSATSSSTSAATSAATSSPASFSLSSATPSTPTITYTASTSGTVPATTSPSGTAANTTSPSGTAVTTIFTSGTFPVNTSTAGTTSAMASTTGTTSAMASTSGTAAVTSATTGISAATSSTTGSTPGPSPIQPPSVTGRPMGKAPLFCTYGVHQQDYDAISIDGCDYAFVPFYVQGGDTFVDDSSAFVQRLIAKAANSTTTAYVISVAFGNRSTALTEVRSPLGRAKIEQYWATKKIFHYAVFDIYFLPGGGDPNVGLREAFDLLKEFRTQQTDLKLNHPGLQGAPQRGFVVAGIYFHPSNYRAVLGAFEAQLRNFSVDGVIPYTHLPVDEHQAGLTCTITGSAPYNVSSVVNLLGMDRIMRDINRRTAADKPSLAVSVSLCTRLYMPVRNPALDAACASHMRLPNTTAAFCNDPMSLYSRPNIRRQDLVAVGFSARAPRLVTTFDTNETISLKYCKVRQYYEEVGLALFEVECEDWTNACGNQTMALAGTDRFRGVTTYFSSLANVPSSNLTCI